MATGMDFSNALNALKADFKVTRAGWNGRNMWIHLQEPTELSKMIAPYIYMRTTTGDLVPWLASQTDIFANDWEISDE